MRRNIQNGTISSTTKAIRSLKEYKRNGRGFNNSNNVISQGTRENRQIDRLYNREVEQKVKSKQKRNSNKGNRNQSGINNNDSTRSMQNIENNTNNDEVRILKNNKLANKGNYNIIKLGKREYTDVVKAINTVNQNLPNGINYKFYDDNFYVLEKFDFYNYTFVAKIPIANNEDSINQYQHIMEMAKNG